MARLPNGLTRADDWALRAVTGGAVIFAGLGIIGVIARVIQLISDRTATLELQLAERFDTAAVDALPGVRYSTASTVQVVFDEVPEAAVGWLVGETAARGLLSVGLCVIVALIGYRTWIGRPFGRTVTVSLIIAAGLIMVCGISADALAGFAAAAATDALDDRLFGGFQISVQGQPFSWALGLGVIATAFHIGARMQRDTDTLV
jgi:hypothetical protein